MDPKNTFLVYKNDTEAVYANIAYFRHGIIKKRSSNGIELSANTDFGESPSVLIDGLPDNKVLTKVEPQNEYVKFFNEKPDFLNHYTNIPINLKHVRYVHIKQSADGQCDMFVKYKFLARNFHGDCNYFRREFEDHVMK